jgi:hypothetical protein
MNEDNSALKIFNRLNDYLKKHNAYVTFKIENEIIYVYSYFFNEWIEWWNSYIDLSLDKACEWFLLGSPGKVQTEIGDFEKYESFFVLHNNSKDPIVKQICNYIGEPTCLEEITLKMDLMGI